MVLWRTSNNDGLYNAEASNHGFLVRRDQALMDMEGGTDREIYPEVL
jgi:hypothetical protein